MGSETFPKCKWDSDACSLAAGSGSRGDSMVGEHGASGSNWCVALLQRRSFLLRRRCNTTVVADQKCHIIPNHSQSRMADFSWLVTWDFSLCSIGETLIGQKTWSIEASGQQGWDQIPSETCGHNLQAHSVAQISRAGGSYVWISPCALDWVGL